MYLDFQNGKGEGLVDWNSKGIGAGGGEGGLRSGLPEGNYSFATQAPAETKHQRDQCYILHD